MFREPVLPRNPALPEIDPTSVAIQPSRGATPHAAAQCAAISDSFFGFGQNMSRAPSVPNQKESGSRSVHHCQSQRPSIGAPGVRGVG